MASPLLHTLIKRRSAPIFILGSQLRAYPRSHQFEGRWFNKEDQAVVVKTVIINGISRIFLGKGPQLKLIVVKLADFGRLSAVEISATREIFRPREFRHFIK
jgi:hypothetical protein